MKMVEQLEEKYSTVFRLGKIWTFFYQGEQHQLMGVLSNSEHFKDGVISVPLRVYRNNEIYQPLHVLASDQEFDRIYGELMIQFESYIATRKTCVLKAETFQEESLNQ